MERSFYVEDFSGSKTKKRSQEVFFIKQIIYLFLDNKIELYEIYFTIGRHLGENKSIIQMQTQCILIKSIFSFYYPNLKK